MLGIKPDSWVASKERLKFTVGARRHRQSPGRRVRVTTDAFGRDFSHRRRLIGGFYAYEHGYETRRASATRAAAPPTEVGPPRLRDAAARDR